MSVKTRLDKLEKAKVIDKSIISLALLDKIQCSIYGMKQCNQYNCPRCHPDNSTDKEIDVYMNIMNKINDIYQ